MTTAKEYGPGKRQRMTNSRLWGEIPLGYSVRCPNSARRRKPQLELLRLRAEVTRLRSEMAQHAATIPPSPSAGGQPPKGASIADVGTDTPEHSSTSLIWAITTHQKDRFAELVKFPDDVSAEQAAKLHDHLFRQFTNTYARWQFSSVRRTLLNDDGSVKSYFGYRDIDTGREDELLISLRDYDSTWKVVIDDVPRRRPGRWRGIASEPILSSWEHRNPAILILAADDTKNLLGSRRMEWRPQPVGAKLSGASG